MLERDYSIRSIRTPLGVPFLQDYGRAHCPFVTDVLSAATWWSSRPAPRGDVRLDKTYLRNNKRSTGRGCKISHSRSLAMAARSERRAEPTFGGGSWNSASCKSESRSPAAPAHETQRGGKGASHVGFSPAGSTKKEAQLSPHPDRTPMHSTSSATADLKRFVKLPVKNDVDAIVSHLAMIPDKEMESAIASHGRDGKTAQLVGYDEKRGVDHTDPMRLFEACKEAKVLSPTESPELFKAVEKLVKESLSGERRRFELLCVDVIHNPDLSAKFKAAGGALKGRSPEEMKPTWGFHGTAAGNISGICKHGILPSGHPLNPNPGRGMPNRPGVWASEGLGLAIDHANDLVSPAVGQTVQVVACAALLGTTQITHDTVTPRAFIGEPGSGSSHFDSVRTGNPAERVIYLSSPPQLLPGFVLYLQRLPDMPRACLLDPDNSDF